MYSSGLAAARANVSPADIRVGDAQRLAARDATIFVPAAEIVVGAQVAELEVLRRDARRRQVVAVGASLRAGRSLVS